MEQQGRLGSAIYGTGMVGLGLVSLLRHDAVPDLEPLPAGLPMRFLVAMLAALLLLTAGLALIARWHTARAAGTVGALLSVWAVTLFLPAIVANPKNGGAWVVFWELAALGAAAWMLAANTAGQDGDASRSNRVSQATHIARITFGLAFVAFGISHFVYRGYVESVIPAWIPAHTFFAYATGVAHIAAGLSLLARVLDELAATLLAAMFASWVLIVHIPRVFAAPKTPNEWTSMLVALGMCGGSLIVRSCLASAHSVRVHASPRPAEKPSTAMAEPWRSRS